jgi:TetR/AcrR family tetracycline transcriptional repressor
MTAIASEVVPVASRRKFVGDAPRAMKLSADEIVAAAAQLLEEVGVSGFTIRKLTVRLGVSVGATYYHVPNKHAMLRVVADDLHRRVDAGRRENDEGDWAERLSMLVVRYRALFGRYRGLVAYMTAHPSDFVPAALYAYTIELLREAGYEEHRCPQLCRNLWCYTAGSLTVGSAQTADSFGLDDADFAEGLRLLLLGLRADIGRSEPIASR